MARRLLTSPYTPVVFVALLVAVLPLVLPSAFYMRLATLVFINAMVVVGLNLLMGYAGQISLGHGAFFALGAYAAAIGPAHLGVPPWAALVVGVVVTAIVAFVVGRPVLRFKGYHLAVVTLGLGVMLSIVLVNEVNWTGGPDGMAVKRLTIGDWRAYGVQRWYWIAGVSLVVGMFLVANLLSSSTGRALRALHDSEVAAGALGVDVGAHKLTAFVISAVFAALAGAYLALFDGHVTPVVGGAMRSVEFVAMAVLGGLGSLLGGLFGAAVLVALPQALTAFHDYEQAMLGLVLMGLMIFLRRGVVPTVHGWILRRLA
jgi:branched-chain amino acid transport system permease protein